MVPHSASHLCCMCSCTLHALYLRTYVDVAVLSAILTLQMKTHNTLWRVCTHALAFYFRGDSMMSLYASLYLSIPWHSSMFTILCIKISKLNNINIDEIIVMIMYLPLVFVLDSCSSLGRSFLLVCIAVASGQQPSTEVQPLHTSPRTNECNLYLYSRGGVDGTSPFFFMHSHTHTPNTRSMCMTQKPKKKKKKTRTKMKKKKQ